MSTSVQIEPRAGKDGYGAPSYGPAVSYRAHLRKGARLSLLAQQAGVVDAMQVYLDGNAAVLATARITLSTADMGSTETYDLQPLVLGVDRLFDGQGPHHTVVYCGWTPRTIG